MGAFLSTSLQALPMRAVAAKVQAADGDGILDRLDDSSVLDEWEFPVGEWVEQAVDWAVVNLSGVLSVIEWPFQQLFKIVVDNGLVRAPWIAVIIGFFVVGSLIRGIKVGTLAAVSLFVCGLLGTQYWDETMKTIGMILVSVFLCALVGIPVGVACGRFDGVWATIRPILDAMQVIHTFVYMLPVIFFYGLGQVPATMVTMIFAVPPLVRLTNLGIRQVPEDVVEASRSFGAPEYRVLTDVQLPLARPAIMTGLNQTLLLAISMGGIAAIMGAGGLGLKVFRAVQNIDVALAGSAGLAFFLVAVVLDRISQPGGGSGPHLLARIRTAWSNRETPENLIGEPGFTAPSPGKAAENFTAVGGRERTAALATIIGGLVATVSTFLVWGSEAGLVTSYSRESDVNLAGQSFNGLAASGGSFFGILTLVGGLFAIACGAFTLWKPGKGTAWLNATGATLAAGLAAGASLGYVMAKPPVEVTDFVYGPGAFVGLAGSLVALVAAWYWMWNTPTTEIKPQPGGLSGGRIAGGIIALLLVTISLYGGWSYDNRLRTVFTPELEAEMEEIVRQVEEGELAANIGAQQMQNLNNKAVRQTEIVLDGKGSDGAELGWPSLALGLLGLVLLIPAAGFVRPRLQLAMRNYQTAEAGSGRGFVALTGVVLAVATMTWVYAVDSVVGTEVSAAGNTRNVVAKLGPVLLKGTTGRWIELIVIHIVIIGSIIALVRAKGPRAEARIATLIALGGIASIFAVMVWRFGPTPVIATVATVALIAGVGMMFREQTAESQWAWSGITAAVGMALMGLSGGWILSLLRATDSKFFSGIGSAMALTAGFVLLASSRGILGDFGRAKVYGDLAGPTPAKADDASSDAEDLATEPRMAGSRGW